MKLPKELQMAESHYQAHAWKLVENRRKEIQTSLNMTTYQNTFSIFAVIAGIFLVIILLAFVGFRAAIIGAISNIILMFIAFFFIPSHPAEYGEWYVYCDKVRLMRGGTVKFRCERIVNGEIVESMTKS